MIVQIDIDGTLDQAPEFFAWLTGALRRDGHTILIVSSRIMTPETFKLSAEEILAFGIVYDKLILTPAVEDLDPHRLPRFLHQANRPLIFKVFVAQDHGVGILFDDCSITGNLFERYVPSVKVFRPIRSR